MGDALQGLSGSPASLPQTPVESLSKLQAENSVEDLFTFIRNQAGFEQGAKTPPTFNSASASPFGTAAHAQASAVRDEMVRIGVKGADRVYSEVAVNKATGTITQIGGRPIRGHHNLDLVAMPKGQGLSVGQTLGPGQAEVVGDIKYGAGKISQAHTNFGQSGVTVNSTFNSTASSSNAPVRPGTSLGASVEAAPGVARSQAALPQAAKLEQAATTVGQGAKAETTLLQAARLGDTASKGAQVVKAESTVARILGGAGGTLATVAAKVAPWVGKAGKVLAPVGQVLGKIATPVAFIGAGVQWATAKTTKDYVDAGMSTVSAGLMAAPHPVAKAAGAGIAAGQLIEQTLDVSDYSSAIGIKTKELGERIGAGETASFVAGAVATVASTPSSITIAAADKITGGRFARWIGLK
jgi:hypothetical protein